MPRTVNACFTQLNTNIVNLDSKVRNIALSSRDNLITSLHTLSDKGLIPPSYPERDMYIGSFARKTKIRPLDDIDLMICFNGQGGHYEIVQINQIYKIIIPDRTTILSELRNEDNSLNSRSLLCLIRDNLSELHDFRMADIHYNKEACTLQLKSYTWNFDIVPCFYTRQGLLLSICKLISWTASLIGNKHNGRTLVGMMMSSVYMLTHARRLCQRQTLWRSQIPLWM